MTQQLEKQPTFFIDYHLIISSLPQSLPNSVGIASGRTRNQRGGRGGYVKVGKLQEEGVYKQTKVLVETRRVTFVL